jgi:sugar (glycoside-pentoside-hexuronide) transporter
MKNTSLSRCLAYAFSDTGGQLVFCVISFYLLKFYTDVFGISAAAAGTILLIARMIDAVDAPVWGIIFDKTHSKWGKSRPWFLWLCVPFAVFGVLTFLTPDLGYRAKVAYAAITYVICSILYTGINTPVTSILASLTSSPSERITFTSFRMFGSKLGVLVVNLTAFAMVSWLGGVDPKNPDPRDVQRGFMLTMPIFATGTILLFLFAFWKLDERVKEEKKSLSIRQSFSAIKGNWPWLIIFISSLFFWIAFISRICISPYFWEYTLHRIDLIGPANSLDFVSLAGILFLPLFVRLTSKRTAWIVGLIGAVAAQFVIWFGIRSGSLPLVMTGWILGIILSGIAMAMPFSLLSDSVDYGEWKSGVRAAGLLTAVGAAFCLKAGSGLGGALPAWILDWYHYVPNTEQAPSALFGIEVGFLWLPAVFYALAVIPVFFYHHFERLEPQIRQELELRRSAAGAMDAAV